MDQQQDQTQSVNIHVGSSDPLLEQRIFGKVASDGRQLARMADVMAILLTQFENTQGNLITPSQRESINEFHKMCDSIKKEKARRTAEHILDQLDSLQRNDAAEYDKVLTKLRARLVQDVGVSTMTTESAT